MLRPFFSNSFAYFRTKASVSMQSSFSCMRIRSGFSIASIIWYRSKFGSCTTWNSTRMCSTVNCARPACDSMPRPIDISHCVEPTMRCVATLIPSVAELFCIVTEMSPYR
uniref:Uncharacterized protein n=1 Tax=Anopheles culicifacies TaxID=139723 RepID=A0A182LWE9_9DIPT